MTKDEDFKLLKIQTCILRVNLYCDGCKHKVKKLLQRIDGVYQVNIDAGQQVTVSGSVDTATLIKKLVKAGKHAELWSNKSNETHNKNQQQNHQNKKGSCVKDDKNNKAQKQDFLKALESLKNQQKFQPLISEEDEDDYLDDDGGDDDDDNVDDEKHEEELRLQATKANQLAFLRQQQQHAAAVAANNARNSNNNNINNNINGNGNNSGKPVNVGSLGKDNLNQNGGVKMSNNLNVGEGKKVNDMSSIMNNLDGFGNLGGFQVPQKNTLVGSGGAGSHLPDNGPPIATSGYNPLSQAAAIMNMNGGGQPQQHNTSVAASMMMMNMQNRQAMQHQQPQMMYYRSPVIPAAIGYYNYNPAPYTYNEHPHNYYTAANGGGAGAGHNSAAYMFSDENTSSCSVM